MRAVASVKYVEVKSRAELRRWLRRHYRQAESIWLITYKKSAGKHYVSYDEIVEEALCFGWIDSLPRKLDETRTMVRLSPRSKSSAWSRVNKVRVAKLIRQKLMAPAGLEVVRLAKKNKTWNKLDEASSLRIPADLKKMFLFFAGGESNFRLFPPSSRRAILEWISAARTPETRLKRVKETARLAQKNLRANHYRQTAGKTGSSRKKS